MEQKMATGIGALLAILIYILIIVGIIIFAKRMLTYMRIISEAQQASAEAQTKILELFMQKEETQDKDKKG